jgi:arylsulfatase A-like enzyme
MNDRTCIEPLANPAFDPARHRRCKNSPAPPFTRPAMKLNLPPALPLLAALFLGSLAAPAADRPNILWLTSEDHGPHMGCYGDKVARTPNVDALAARGMIFKHAWSIAPVCAPARTAIISGLYPSSSGGLHMRSMVSLPPDFKMYPQYLREVGYYCTNNSKTDYNLREPGQVWDESSNKAHWSNRSAGQPFFAIFNSTKSHESQIRTRPHAQITKPEDVRVPEYHPDTPEVRQDWAQYYDKVSEADADAGARLRELEAAGLAEDTIVFYYADHGSGMPRGKRWPSNSGLHVPMVVYFPEKWRHLAPREYQPGGVSERPVSFVDLAPTVISLAGAEPPQWLQGHAFAGPHQSEPKKYVFGERGRMDERMDLVRSVTDGRFVYLRNYFPHVSQAQRVAYQFETPTTRIWHDLFQNGRTNEAQSIFWREPKDVEELYDLESDPDEVRNLAGSPAHREIQETLRAALREHLISIRDVTFLPEREIHTRSEDTTPYETARSDSSYPFEEILSAAEIASSATPAMMGQVADLLDDPDSAVRAWAARGLLVLGPGAVSAHAGALEAALKDPSPDVRIIAAESLAKFGSGEQTAAALAVLEDLSHPARHGVLVAMPALAAVEAIGPKAAAVAAKLAGIPSAGDSPDGRYNSYVPRLLMNLGGGQPQLPDKGKKAPAKGKGRDKSGN